MNNQTATTARLQVQAAVGAARYRQPAMVRAWRGLTCVIASAALSLLAACPEVPPPRHPPTVPQPKMAPNAEPGAGEASPAERGRLAEPGRP